MESFCGEVALIKAPMCSKQPRSKATWHKAPSAIGRPAEVKPRLIVFMAGGMTYSEMRTCYECSNSLGQDIYIGGFFSLFVDPKVRCEFV